MNSRIGLSGLLAVILVLAIVHCCLPNKQLERVKQNLNAAQKLSGNTIFLAPMPWPGCGIRHEILHPDPSGEFTDDTNSWADTNITIEVDIMYPTNAMGDGFFEMQPEPQMEPQQPLRSTSYSI